MLLAAVLSQKRGIRTIATAAYKPVWRTPLLPNMTLIPAEAGIHLGGIFAPPGAICPIAYLSGWRQAILRCKLTS